MSKDNITQVQQPILPEEILIKIFKLVVDRDGPVPRLCRLAQVCSQWRNIAQDESFWREVDLSSGWINKTNGGVRTGIIFTVKESCSNLTTLDISSCEHLSENTLPLIADEFQHLHSLDVGNLSPLVVGSKPLRYFLTKTGSRLKRLNLSSNHVCSDFTATLSRWIFGCCSQLEELILSHLECPGGYVGLDVRGLCAGCPALRVLDLSETLMYGTNTDNTAGLQRLQEFHSPVCHEDNTVIAVVSAANTLKSLYLSDATGLCLERIRSSTLTTLAFRVNNSDLLFMLSMWQHSLEVLDLTTGTSLPRVELDAAFEGMFLNSNFTRLRVLILCGNDLSWKGLSAILTHCHTLKRLNCVRCRHISRAWAQDLQGRTLSQLYLLVHGRMDLKEFESLTVMASQTEARDFNTGVHES